MREVTRRAHAKVNLFLRVHGLREDGYHDLSSLIVPLSLHDTVVCREAGRLNLSIGGGDPSLGSGPDNLAVVAALVLGERAGSLQGADIELTKRIPVAAGLGGGSADAAAVLAALNELWACGLDEEQLMEVAAEVGSDVPATLAARPVLVAGRGERLQDAVVPDLHWVVVPAGFQIRTPDAFRWWDEYGGSTGPDPSGLIDALASSDLGAAAAAFYNDLEGPVLERHPELARVGARLVEGGALTAIMCGSGPTMAGLFADGEDASAASEVFPGAIVAGTRGTA